MNLTAIALEGRAAVYRRHVICKKVSVMLAIPPPVTGVVGNGAAVCTGFVPTKNAVSDCCRTIRRDLDRAARGTTLV